MPELFAETSQQTINQTTSGNQSPTLVETAADGASLVIWSTDSPASGTRARVIGADGTPIGGEFTLPTGARGTLLANGDVAALYVDGGVKVQRYEADGTAIGGPVTIAAAGTALDIELLASGGAVVTYASGTTIFAQLLDTALALSGSSIAAGIYDSTTPAPTESFVAPLAGGGFVHLWDPDGNSGAVEMIPQFRVFDALGNQVGQGPVSAGRQDDIDVTALPDGGFVVAGKTENAPSAERPFVQIFNADGTARTGVIQFGNYDQHIGVGFNRETFDIQVAAVSDDVFMATGRTTIPETGLVAQLFHVSGRAIGPLFNLSGSTAAYQLASAGDDGFVIASPVTGTATDVDFQIWSVLRGNLAFGTPGSDVLDASGGSKLLYGFAADDHYLVDDINDVVNEIAGEGFDRVSSVGDYALAAGASVEHFTTSFNAGTAAINLYGNELAQAIYGNEGNNSLTGGGGGDTLLGLGGNDRYYTGHASDQVREAVGGGTDDRVYAGTSFVLTAGQEVEIIAATYPAFADAINLTGNEFGQYIYGNAGANRLEGGGGGDVLIGLGGNDTYVVGDARDSVREAVGEGSDDRVYTSIGFTLLGGQEIELLATTAQAGVAALNLNGNEFGQQIQGNDGANVLDGRAGADTLVGLGGDDRYYVDNASDAVSEASGGGNDRVLASTSWQLTGGSHVETLSTTNNAGTAAINLTGSSVGGQLVYGNAGANTLGGGGGGDQLNGFGGNDSYLVVDALDQVFEALAGGNDRVYASVSWQLHAGSEVETVGTNNNNGTAAINLTGNERAQSVYGNAGANVIGGGAGKDSLVGLGGADQYLFDTALNKTYVAAFNLTAATDNVDVIYEFVADDRILLASDIFGLPTGALAAGAFNLGTVANEADDRVLYDAASRALLFDADGAGGAPAQLIAFLNTPFALDASYITVV